MRLKIAMIDDLGNCHGETVIANNKNEVKQNVKLLNQFQGFYKIILSINKM